MAESRKVGELERDGHYSYVLFVVHTSVIEIGWIDASFLQGLKHNKWDAIPGFVQNGHTQNVKMDHKKSFTKVSRLCRCFLCKDTSTPQKQTLNLEGCTIFVKLF